MRVDLAQSALVAAPPRCRTTHGAQLQFNSVNKPALTLGTDSKHTSSRYPVSTLTLASLTSQFCRRKVLLECGYIFILSPCNKVITVLYTHIFYHLSTILVYQTVIKLLFQIVNMAIQHLVNTIVCCKLKYIFNKYFTQLARAMGNSKTAKTRRLFMYRQYESNDVLYFYTVPVKLLGWAPAAGSHTPCYHQHLHHGQCCKTIHRFHNRLYNHGEGPYQGLLLDESAYQRASLVGPSP